MKKDHIMATIALVATAFLWGISFSSTKYLLNTLHVEQVAFFRLLLAVLVMGIIFLIRYREKVNPRDIFPIFAGGTCGTFLYFMLENNGLRFTTAGMASLIIATIPVLNILAGKVLFRKEHTPRQWIGVTLSFLGVYLIMGSINGTLTTASLQGNLLVFAAACAWVGYTRINEPLMQRYRGLTLNLLQFLVGMFLFMPFAFNRGNPSAIWQPAITLNLLYLGVLCSALAFFLYLYALKKLGSVVVTTFLNLVPVFGILGGYFIHAELLSSRQWLGATIIIIGVSMVTLSKKNAPA